MKFTVPYVINEPPCKSHYKSLYADCGMTAKFAYLTAKKVYKRTRLAEAQNWKCCWCGCKMVPEPMQCNSVTVEHILPRSQGGSNEMDNLAAACHRCNNKRGTLTIDDFMQNLPIRNQQLKAA